MSKDYSDRTKEDLQQEARDRELPTTGTKQDIIDRLESHDAESYRRGSDAGNGVRARPMDRAREAARQLAQLTGRPVEGVSGVGPTDDGWRVTVDVVEVARIPSSADVVACYEIVLDDDGELLGYERVGRYVRGAVSGA
jgi:hypothetical protein